ncbi:uncharacterized protein LOC135083004 [Ostrinia nubilalis]|uniref:uncharacterized protein LOC135083004 n=1 Tax=Ostrinia nubilalis TaxID=29057 RepID=UPI00308239E9
MFSLNCVILALVSFAIQTRGLVELPKVDDNNILVTEAAIRDTINTLFYKLGLRGIKTKPRLKEYSTVHNHLVSFTLQDYTNLKEIAKLTRVDKTKINNETRSFMTVINEILNEDNDDGRTEAIITEANDESVIKYIDQFLTKLEDLKEQYGVINERFPIKEDLYKVLNDNEVLPYNFTMDQSYSSDVDENDTLIDGSNYWKPDMSGRRIYRGTRTKIKHFPFMASIQIFNRFHCGGSIIKSDLVITASSCLQLAWNNRFFRENPAFLSVRVGSNFYNGGGENIPVLEVYFHPQYNPKNLWNNICILRLVRRLRFRKRGKKVKKIDFDRNPANLPLTTDGITIVGWGAKGMSNVVKNPWENALSFSVLDIYPLRECQDIYSKEYVTKKHFCAGFFSKGGGACNHDVGGPGVVKGFLMGVVSFGSPVCGTPDAPTVFTKLGYYADWIEEIMEQEVPNINQRTTLRRKSIVTLGQYYQPIQPTTFKIPPLSGKIDPIPISEVDALRMLKSGKIFQEFLNTMFGSSEAAQYQDLLTDVQPRNDQVMPAAESTMNSPPMPIQVPETTTPMQASIEDAAQVVTEIGVVDPDFTTEAQLMKVTALDENFAISSRKDDDLEKNLVNLIDDIDLKEIIDGMPSVEEERLLDDEKIMDMLKDKDLEDKISKIDDSVLTLLYLSDAEKAERIGDSNNGEDISGSSAVDKSDDGLDNYYGEAEERGLSIPTENFQDLTYRNNNASVAVDQAISNDQLYYLISEINDNDAKNIKIKY